MRVNRLFQKAEALLTGVGRPSVFVELSPFLIEPNFVGKVWGYTDLHPWFDKVATEDPIGEVWLTGDQCHVASGKHTGKTLAALFREAPHQLLGKKAPHAGSPLLIKVLFAQEKLSVQVHPDDRIARKYGEPNGKSECWYALAAQRDAKVALGLKRGVTLDQVRDGMLNGTLEESLKILSVAAGDLLFVDTGTVHAIWPGSVLLETQQYSDLTYRMYDYGRGRELHVEKSLEATRLETRAGKVQPRVLPDRTILALEDYFCVERIPIEASRPSSTLPGEGERSPGLSFLFVASGSGRLVSPSFGSIELAPRSIIAVPASSPMFAVHDLGGLELIRISPRWPEKS
jgi:mannose-6-phosphate isomerase